MPKPKYIISDSEKNLIHHELYKKTGILIRTKSDCRIISELIEVSGELISESTLYRMFIQKKTIIYTLHAYIECAIYVLWI